MTVETKHSAGAMRAAERLIGDDGCRLFVHDSKGSGSGAWEDVEHVAEIISAHTHDSELLEALERISRECGLSATCASLSSNDSHHLFAYIEYQRIADTAIRKAKEGR